MFSSKIDYKNISQVNYNQHTTFDILNKLRQEKKKKYRLNRSKKIEKSG